MNHLAHFHLAAPEGEVAQAEDLVLGALLGDHIKGPLRGHLAPGLEAGVALHRFVDAFTDSDPALSRAHTLLPASCRRYRGIVFDIGFDWCLSRHWQQFDRRPLPAFNAAVCAVLDRREGELEPPVRRQARWLMEHAVLESMGDWERVERALRHVGMRLKRPAPLELAARALKDREAELEAVFLEFYPRLQRAAKARRVELSSER